MRILNFLLGAALGLVAFSSPAQALDNKYLDELRLQWKSNPNGVLESLTQKVELMEEGSLAPRDRPSLTRGYWMLAQATAALNKSCVESHKALVKARTLGLHDAWPGKYDVQAKALALKLSNCVSDAVRAQASVEAVKEISGLAAVFQKQPVAFTRSPVDNSLSFIDHVVYESNSATWALAEKTIPSVTALALESLNKEKAELLHSPAFLTLIWCLFGVLAGVGAVAFRLVAPPVLKSVGFIQKKRAAA